MTRIVFRSALKSGLATAVNGVADHNGVPEALTAPVTLKAEGDGLSVPIIHEFEILGPQSITGIEPGQIARVEPVADTQGFEKNYFPYLEFVEPDFPWRHTPALPNAKGRLIPWLVLVVVPMRDTVHLKKSRSGPDILSIEADAQSLLPNLNEAHLWAHVQSEDDRYELARILCPVRLAAETRYLAALVPTFEAGRLVGLGLEPDEAVSNAFAWSVGDGAGETIDLPVYFSWRFTTGAEDFEELARRLSPVEPDPGLGIKPLDITNPGSALEIGALGLPVDTPQNVVIDFASALVVKNAKRRGWRRNHKHAFQAKLENYLTPRARARARSQDYDPLVDDDPVGPPSYGSWQTGTTALTRKWASDLNLDPAHRLAAGLASRTVRRNQESYMAQAWRQAADAKEAQALMRRSRVAIGVGGAIHTRLSKLPVEALLQITAPAHARISLSDSTGTVTSELAGAQETPSGAFDPALVRMAVRAQKPVQTVIASVSGSVVSTHLLAGVAELVMDERIRKTDLSNIEKTPRKSFDYDISAVPSPIRSTSIASRRSIRRSATAISGNLLRVSREELALLSPKDLGDSKLVKSSKPILESRRSEARSGVPGNVAKALIEATDPLPKLEQALFSRVTGVARRSFAPVPIPPVASIAVEFDIAASEDLASRSPGVFVPGIGDLPMNGVSMVTTNAEFVAAFLAGMNHEMSREFAWRGFPAQLHGTWFKRFWDYTDGRRDIGNISEWKKRGGLAKQIGAETGANSVILVRSELLQRYPDTLVYAVPGRWARNGRSRTVGAAEWKEALAPAFTGRIGRGVSFYGFDLDVETMTGDGESTSNPPKPGWFIVFEQPQGTPDFGLDEPLAFMPSTAPARADDLSWGHFAKDQATLDGLSHVPGTTEWSDTPIDRGTWGQNAADVASLTWQRPVRVLIHANSLVGPAVEG